MNKAWRKRTLRFGQRIEAARRQQEELHVEERRLNARFKEELDRIQQDLADGRKRVQQAWQDLNQHQPNWIEELIHPIRDALQEHYPDWSFEVMGPFGIPANTSIWGTPPDAEEAKGWLEFRPKNLAKGEVEVVQTWKHTGQFKQNTIGELNGLNHPTMPMPETFDQLLMLFHHAGEDEAVRVGPRT